MGIEFMRVSSPITAKSVTGNFEFFRTETETHEAKNPKQKANCLRTDHFHSSNLHQNQRVTKGFQMMDTHIDSLRVIS
jgi:hypothetical protein